jgi:hypothetical protein
MTIYASALIGKPTFTGGLAGDTKMVMGKIAGIGPALVAGDKVRLAPMPRWSRIGSLWIFCEDADANGTPTLRWDIGDNALANRYADDSTLGQAAGAQEFLTADTIGFEYTVNDEIVMTVVTAPATAQGAAFDIGYRIQYLMR